MNATQIKSYLLENNRVEEVLEEIGCHSIKEHSDYWTCGNLNGNNKNAITVYKDNLHVINYTRTLSQPSDLITLIEFNKELNFFHALKWIHQLLNLDYYSEFEPDLPESIRTGKMLLAMRSGKNYDEDNTPVKPIDESILSYYQPYVNDFWKNDNVPYAVQKEFELMYDEWTNRIVIPIRDETGQLVGVKGRLFKKELDEDDLKYVYIEPTSKSKILYGYYKTYDFIKLEGKCYCLEAEKAVHQLWSYGYKNCISLGGKKISKTQIEKLTRLGVDIVLCLDKDVQQKELEDIANQFIDGVNVYAIIDTNNILESKQSPSDSPDKWKILVENNLYKLK